MSKHRSITQQLQYSIRDHITLGHSKYAERAMGVENRIYSIQHSENLLQTADQFGRWLKENHPEIKWVKNIRPEIVKEYIEFKQNQGQWNSNTIYTKVSQLGKIGELVNETYHSHVDFKINFVKPSPDGNIRNVAMDRVDIEKLKTALAPESNGRTAVEVADRAGLRIREIAHLRAENINLEKQIIEIREGGKNGKYRDVPIRNKDLNYFRDLKGRIGTGYVTHGVQEDSLNRAMRRALEREGLAEKYEKTTNHAIRKTYARDRYEEELRNGQNEKRAWETIQEELGHEPHTRNELLHTYIGK